MNGRTPFQAFIDALPEGPATPAEEPLPIAA